MFFFRIALLSLVFEVSHLALAGVQVSTISGARNLSLKKNDFVSQARTVGLKNFTENQATGLPKFLVFDVEQSSKFFTASNPEKNASFFISKFGRSFGLNHPSELKISKNSQDYAGRSLVHYKQFKDDIPVFAGEIKFLFDANGRLISINNDIIPVEKLDSTPRIDLKKGQEIALSHIVAESGNFTPANIHIEKSRLVVFRSGYIQGISGYAHLAYEVSVTDHGNIGRNVFVDAHTGEIIDSYSTVHAAMNRQVSEKNLTDIVWKEGDTFPTANLDWNNELDGSREAYNLFASMAGRDSYDGLGSMMKVVNNDPRIQCPNANWNGVSTNYCTGVTGDDTIAHEWGHAFTEHTNGLVYQWEPGALNESYSDIWGEVVDLLNQRGLDTPDVTRTAAGCSKYGQGGAQDASYRWLSGEDDPAFSGAIRDMWNPNCYDHPGKVSDGKYYCKTSDGGGVHSNSGVNNHAFALMVDGGVYNAVDVKGLGLTKSSHIFWGAQNILNATSGHAEQAAALVSSCRTLIGKELSTISTSNPDNTIPSGETVTEDDCQMVIQVVNATELNNKPLQCQFKPMLKSNPPELCKNQGNGTVNMVSSTDWETGMAGWTVGRRAVKNEATFSAADWSIQSSLPDSRNGSAIFGANNPKDGDCNEDIESGVTFLESPEMMLSADVSVLRLTFDHWVATEAGWDGGNLKISVNGGAWLQVKRTDFGFNPYNSTLTSTFSGSNNPNAGQAAFTGTDGGEVKGSWGQSQLTLKNYVKTGDKFKLRFEMGLDDCSGMNGWFVDDVRFYSCGAEQ